MSDRLSGFYKIRSVAIKDEAAAGVTLIQPTYQLIRVGADVNIWNIKPNDNGTYHLSLVDKYAYTGVLEDSKRQVIATIEEKDNREWNITRISENGPYVITLSARTVPSSAWTLAEPVPNADIVLRPYPVGPETPKEQLFKLEHIDA